jgi:hypothetical protein
VSRRQRPVSIGVPLSRTLGSPAGAGGIEKRVVPSAMHDVLILLVKGVCGGLLVVAFALLSEGLSPKRFAGLFGAAPSVAIAGLSITLIDEGIAPAHRNTVGMIAGGVGMVAYAFAVVPLLRRTGPKRAAATALTAWLAASVTVAVPLLVLT